MADQNDPRLEVFFKNLKTSISLKKVSSIEIQIWKIWLEHHNPKVKNSMFLGIAAMNNRQFEKALGYFRLLTEIEPDFAEGWNKRATVAYALGDLDASVLDIQKTIALEPRHFGAMAGLAGDKWSLGFVEETEEQVVKHLDGHMKNVSTNDNKTKAVMKQMREDEEAHGLAAREAGAADLPEEIKEVMSAVAKIMTSTSYQI